MIVHSFTDDALGDLDATGVAAAIAAGEVSAAEVVDAAIARAERVEPRLGAIGLRNFARAHAMASRRRPGVFSGVPTFIKDNVDVAGMPTSHGSLAADSRPKNANEPFIDQFLSLGVTVLGKTTLPEFGFNITTEFEARHPTRNPWNTSFSAGGSSGGAAALVAAGVVPIAHANDGGGSTRIPAAACGLVGLKLTRGRELPTRHNGLPVDLVSNGVLTRTVRDTARFAAAVESHRRAPYLEPIGLVEGPSLRRLRVGIMIDSCGETTDAETRAAVERSSALLSKLGHDVEECSDADLVGPTFERDFAHYWSSIAFLTRTFGKRLSGNRFDRSKLDSLTTGLARQFVRRWWLTPAAILGLKQSAARYRKAFEKLDVVLSPVVRYTTPELGYLSPSGDFDVLFPRLLQHVGFTPINNATGGPAISLPLGQTATGLPLGLHFSADWGDERTLLELAFELEAAQPFRRIQDQDLRCANPHRVG